MSHKRCKIAVGELLWKLHGNSYNSFLAALEPGRSGVGSVCCVAISKNG